MIQLRVRTEYQFGESFAPFNRIIARLTGIGCTAAGIADRGTWGHVKWDEACRAAGIQPLFGVSLAVVPDLTSEDRPEMWFLALSEAGLGELYRLSSLAQRQAARGVPRLSFQDVLGVSGEIAKFAGAVLDRELLVGVGAWVDFDPSSTLLNKRKAVLCKELGLRPVVVSDNLYSAPGDRAVFELIGKQSRVTPQHILTSAEMQAQIEGVNFKEAVENLALIVEQAKSVKLPRAPLIKVEGDLEALCRAGIVERGIDPWPDEYEKRLQYELGLIRSKNFESYFLVVQDMTRYAKRHMLVGPSRGSAAGSLVCYLTRITEIDPIPPKLIFERFIDVTRDDLPDIDLDFNDSKRFMVIDYLREKYGKDNVTNIGTVATFQPKSALIAVAKKLGVPPWETNAVKDSIFARSSGDSRANFALMDTLEQTDPGRRLIEKYPGMKLSADLEAHATHCGVHAGGILVCNEPVESFCTVTSDGIAQIDKKDAEKLNLLKIDVLGLRTLGVLEDSGIDVDWYALPLNDPAVFDVLNQKKFAGVFQFEGSSLQSVSSQMEIKSLDDIGHITALARPGPMASGGTTSYLLRRSGKEKFIPPHEKFGHFVSDTYGVIMYQEQVLRVCRELGKMTWEDVTQLRKAMSKSYGKEFFDRYMNKFVAGAEENGIDEARALAIWNTVNTMGSMAFNLAHSYSYAVVSYWVAWLKAKHPLEFAAATLRNSRNDESSVNVLRELIKEGVGYVPFDPELSEVNWSVRDGRLIGGFTGLKGIGESKAGALVEKRAKNGGRLPENEREKVLEAEQIFSDLFPTERRFGEYYKDSERFDIRNGTKVVRIAEITGEAEFVYLGQLRGKDLRDHNEEIRVKRRNGKRKTGPTLFLDLDIIDDTGNILTRIGERDFEEVGRKIWDEAPVGSWWLIRGYRHLWGKPDGGFKMIYVKKIRQLPDPFAKEKK